MPFNSFAPNTVARSNDVNANFNNAVHISDVQKIQNKIPVSPAATATDTTTVTFDLDVANVLTLTLGGDRTLALANDDVGQPFILRLIQDVTGTRIVTWWLGIRWPGGVEPTLTTTGGKMDVFGFLKTDTGEYDGYIVGMGMS